MHSQKYYSHNYTALLNSCCKENREHSFLGQSFTVAWNMYLLHLVFKFLSFWDRCVSFNNLACCDFSAPCIMPLHVMFCFLIQWNWTNFFLWPMFWFNLQILEGLLKLPENRECADCKSKYVSSNNIDLVVLWIRNNMSLYSKN